MFAPGDFRAPTPPRPPMRNDRLVGALVLLLLVVLCLVMSLGMDQMLFVSYNATHAPTETWEAQHPNTAIPTPRQVRPRRTPTPSRNYDQQVEAPINFS